MVPGSVRNRRGPYLENGSPAGSCTVFYCRQFKEESPQLGNGTVFAPERPIKPFVVACFRAMIPCNKTSMNEVLLAFQ